MNQRPLSHIEQEILEELIAITYKVPSDEKTLERGLDLLSLTRMREFLGWHQRQCAQYVDVTRPVWTAWENGTHRPNPQKLRTFFGHVLNVHYARLPHIATFPLGRAIAR